jgi:hypothetical protein
VKRIVGWDDFQELGKNLTGKFVVRKEIIVVVLIMRNSIIIK